MYLAHFGFTHYGTVKLTAKRSKPPGRVGK